MDIHETERARYILERTQRIVGRPAGHLHFFEYSALCHAFFGHQAVGIFIPFFCHGCLSLSRREHSGGCILLVRITVKGTCLQHQAECLSEVLAQYSDAHLMRGYKTRTETLHAEVINESMRLKIADMFAEDVLNIITGRGSISPADVAQRYGKVIAT